MDYLALFVMALAALRSFSDHNTHTSMFDMIKSVSLGLLQATKNKMAELTQRVVDEVKAPPTPRDVGENNKAVVANKTAQSEAPGREAVGKGRLKSMPPPPNSIQARVRPQRGSEDLEDVRAESVRRRRGFMDSKLGSTNKKAVKEDMQTALARKAGYL